MKKGSGHKKVREKREVFSRYARRDLYRTQNSTKGRLLGTKGERRERGL